MRTKNKECHKQWSKSRYVSTKLIICHLPTDCASQSRQIYLPHFTWNNPWFLGVSTMTDVPLPDASRDLWHYQAISRTDSLSPVPLLRFHHEVPHYITWQMRYIPWQTTISVFSLYLVEIKYLAQKDLCILTFLRHLCKKNYLLG